MLYTHTVVTLYAGVRTLCIVLGIMLHSRFNVICSSRKVVLFPFSVLIWLFGASEVPSSLVCSLAALSIFKTRIEDKKRRTVSPENERILRFDKCTVPPCFGAEGTEKMAEKWTCKNWDVCTRRKSMKDKRTLGYINTYKWRYPMKNVQRFADVLGKASRLTERWWPFAMPKNRLSAYKSLVIFSLLGEI